jgi:SanA protein
MSNEKKKQNIKDRRWRILMTVLLVIGILAVMFLISLDRKVANIGKASIYTAESVAPAEAVIALGAQVFPDGRPSLMLADRLETAAHLYRLGKAETIVLSGDGRAVSNNETEAMKTYLTDRGIPEDAIVIDGEGFDTYATVYRTYHVLGYKTAILATQTFHLERALYIADALDIPYTGVSSDLRTYRVMPLMRIREVLARVKALIEVTKKEPPAGLP